MKKSPLTTLCYIERDGCYLMMHRICKENDENQDKWIGIGGHFEEGESPEECLVREAREETGLELRSFRFRGLVTFVSDVWGTEYMCLYTADYPEDQRSSAAGSGQIRQRRTCTAIRPSEKEDMDRQADGSDTGRALKDALEGQDTARNELAGAVTDEGVLEWVPKSEIEKLNLWEGDKIFLRLLADEAPFFSLKLRYEGERLREAVLDGKQIGK